MRYIHVGNGVYIKVWNRESNQRLQNHPFDSFPSVESTVVLVSISLYMRQINTYTNVNSTIAKALIRRLHKCRFDGCASVQSTIVQASNRRSYKRRIDGYNLQIDGYIDYFKKTIKIFRCPFNATALMYMTFD